MAAHEYVISPRGRGLDCHRFWESLYLGITPIVEHSALDPLYRQVENVLFVNSFADVTKDLLDKSMPRFRGIVESWHNNMPPVLTRTYWKARVENVREDAIKRLGIQDVEPRKRCWGINNSVDH